MEKLTIVVPAFNEEEVLNNTLQRLLKIESKLIQAQILDYSSDILVVDDGSADQTWEIIKHYHEKSKSIKGIKLSRNFGHQNALIAGLQA